MRQSACAKLAQHHQIPNGLDNGITTVRGMKWDNKGGFERVELRGEHKTSKTGNTKSGNEETASKRIGDVRRFFPGSV